MPEPRTNGMLSPERLPSELVERIAAMELRIREHEEAARLSETELLAMERDLSVKEAYLRHLERGQQILSVELAQVRERAAELFSDLERAEQRIATAEACCVEATAQLEAFRSSTAFRVGTRLVALGRRLGPMKGIARRLAGPSGPLAPSS